MFGKNQASGILRHTIYRIYKCADTCSNRQCRNNCCCCHLVFFVSCRIRPRTHLSTPIVKMTSREQIISIPLHIKPNKQNDVPVVLRQSISRESFHKHPENDNKPKSEKVYGNVMICSYQHIHTSTSSSSVLANCRRPPSFPFLLLYELIRSSSYQFSFILLKVPDISSGEHVKHE